MRFLSLFAGIGGFDLGLERAGWQCVGQVEIDPFCQKILAKHWPNVPRFDDVRTVTGELVRERCGDIDAIVGGFPCQDISVAGKGEGINAERSGLYWQIHRLAAEVRPRILLLENVPALRTRGADDILLSLAKINYVGWPLVVGDWSLKAPHQRNRCWIVAVSSESRCEEGSGILYSNACQATVGIWPSERLEFSRGNSGGIRRLPDSEFCRMDDGIPERLDIDRIAALGNAVVPQVAEVLGMAILKAFGEGEK